MGRAQPSRLTKEHLGGKQHWLNQSIQFYCFSLIYSCEHLSSALPILHGSCWWLLHVCREQWDQCSGDEHHCNPGLGWEEVGATLPSKAITHHPGSLHLLVDVHLLFVEYTSVCWTACTMTCNVCVSFKLKGGRYNFIAVLTFSGSIKCSQLWLGAPLGVGSYTTMFKSV